MIVRISEVEEVSPDFVAEKAGLDDYGELSAYEKKETWENINPPYSITEKEYKKVKDVILSFLKSLD